MKLLRIILIGVLAILGVIALAFYHFVTDVVTNEYAKLADAKRDQVFGRGWLPNILPYSATSIRTSNNLDTNTSEGEFYFDTRDTQIFLDQLRPYSRTDNPFADYLKKLRRMEAKGYTAHEFSNDYSVWVFLCDSKNGHCVYDMWLKRNG